MWNEIKDEFVHLKPRTPSHLEVSLKGMDDKLFQMFCLRIIILLPFIAIHFETNHPEKDWVTSRRTHHEL